jgi:hypothetical protein
MSKPHTLLWVDCTAALLVGGLVVVFHGALHRIYLLPEPLVLFIGLANLAYGMYSFSLLRPGRATSRAVSLLVAGNLGWAAVCAALAVWFSGTASWLGVGLLSAEAAFVAALALFEWWYRGQIVALGTVGQQVGA